MKMGWVRRGCVAGARCIGGAVYLRESLSAEGARGAHVVAQFCGWAARHPGVREQQWLRYWTKG